MDKGNILWLVLFLVAAGFLILSRRDETIRLPQGGTPPAEPFPQPSHPVSENDKEIFIQENIVDLAEESFPDSAGLAWIIHQIRHRDSMTYVEIEPDPPDAGYERFILAVSFRDPDDPEVLGIYCWDNGEYQLLASNTELPFTLPWKNPL